MKKYRNQILSLALAVSMILGMNTVAFASETQTTGSESQEAQQDNVVVTENDKPYIAFGADLSDDQKNIVMGLMGIDASKLEDYDVVSVNNSEEHEYLDAYMTSNEIGTRSLSSVLIMKGEKGSGINISTYNINYCTAGMYKNALATAGIEDANIIVAGPFELSGTAALVGIFKAYKEMTGEELDQEVVDAAMNELVTTGELEASAGGNSEDLEAMIADLKQQLADGKLATEQDIRDAIDKACDKYGITMTKEEIDKLVSLLQKLQGLDLDWDSIANQAADWADKLGIDLSNIDAEGLGAKIVEFFKNLWDTIMSWFA